MHWVVGGELGTAYPAEEGETTTDCLEDGPRSLKTRADVSMRFMRPFNTAQGTRMTTEDVKLILATSHWTQTCEGDLTEMEKQSSTAKQTHLTRRQRS